MTRDELIQQIDDAADYSFGRYGTPDVADLVMVLLAEAWREGHQTGNPYAFDADQPANPYGA